jgi:hypothetical protein
MGHANKKIFKTSGDNKFQIDNFRMIAPEIERRTDKRTVARKAVSSKPIVLNIYSSSVVNLQVSKNDVTFFFLQLNLCWNP